ncbi:carbohydrate porin [Denitratisoma sp. DHT3]|uniref:carbohydrate porin n=1 Tax=Denitratisoma sp. DHT3 TaxID=1981880 RepID=UPI0021BD523E|nr:carbohydrate porin [Denitratisoma sp. DHT3]
MMAVDRKLKLRATVLATAALFACGTAAAAPAGRDEGKLLKLVQQLTERLDRLEQRNAELERQVRQGQPPAELGQRLQALEQQQTRLNQGLDSDNISELEPEITARLKAVEKDTLDMKKASKKIDALDGLAVGVSLTTVIQRPSGLPRGTADGNSQLNYRADVTAELPLESIGDVEQKLFAHFRLGQGLGLNGPFSNLGAFASAPNAVAFRASGASPDDSVAILGQAWYQASIPLPFGGFKPRSRETLELTFGKMDLFGFFDQNAAAGDESRQFLNSVFVHNPMLDAGGQIGVDANGFQPGIVASYYDWSAKPETWRVSAGIFGTRRGANYQRYFSSPLFMAQLEASMKFFGGLTGNYRAYLWRNGQGLELDGSLTQQAGWGVSADQRLGDGVTVFGRYGQQTKGRVSFDRALTLGAELSGSYWDRGGDALGVAGAWLRASDDYRTAGGSGDLNGDGTGVFTFTPVGAEKVAEIYYRYRITKQFELSPDFQYIWKLGANPDARNASIVGLRAQITF